MTLVRICLEVISCMMSDRWQRLGVMLLAKKNCYEFIKSKTIQYVNFVTGPSVDRQVNRDSTPIKSARLYIQKFRNQEISLEFLWMSLS